ncbi:hypothetical protein [Polynucleobacter sp.]|jgi:hypothetical protein|uniref:hypothetical protein n=1 Tax=Polynucleobacter sp. TaxID=2029855 RepID=UPI003F6A4A53
MILKTLKKYIGSLRFFFALLVTAIFILIIPKDQYTWGLYLASVGAWMGFETVRKSGITE